MLIIWIDDDDDRVLYPHDNALVISADVASKQFDQILVDTKSSVNVLFKSTLDEIGITSLRLENTSTSLKGFGRGKLTLFGVVKLPVRIGTSPFQKTMMLDFVVIGKDNLYQIILGRLFLRISKAVVSNHYLPLKYRVNGVMRVVKGDQRIAQSCCTAAAKEVM